MNQLQTCQTCDQTYSQEESTAKTKVLFCSDSCEDINEAWLREANQTMDLARKENPTIFARTSLTQEQNEAMETFKKLGVKFSSSNLSNINEHNSYIENNEQSFKKED